MLINRFSKYLQSVNGKVFLKSDIQTNLKKFELILFIISPYHPQYQDIREAFIKAVQKEIPIINDKSILKIET